MIGGGQSITANSVSYESDTYSCPVADSIRNNYEDVEGFFIASDCFS